MANPLLDAYRKGGQAPSGGGNNSLLSAYRQQTAKTPQQLKSAAYLQSAAATAPIKQAPYSLTNPLPGLANIGGTVLAQALISATGGAGSAGGVDEAAMSRAYKTNPTLKGLEAGKDVTKKDILLNALITRLNFAGGLGALATKGGNAGTQTLKAGLEFGKYGAPAGGLGALQSSETEGKTPIEIAQNVATQTALAGAGSFALGAGGKALGLGAKELAAQLRPTSAATKTNLAKAALEAPKAPEKASVAQSDPLKQEALRYKSADEFRDALRRRVEAPGFSEKTPNPLKGSYELNNVPTGSVGFGASPSSREAVDSALEAIKAGKQLPPITVKEEVVNTGPMGTPEKVYTVIDGNHRLQAYKQAGVDNVPVLVKRSTTGNKITNINEVYDQAHAHVGDKTPANRAIADDYIIREPGKTPGVPEKVSIQPPALTPDTPAGRVLQAIKEAKPTRRAQEAAYSQERGSRIGQATAASQAIGGEKGYFAGLSKLKGELPKVEYESLRGKISQEDVDHLFTHVQNTSVVTPFERITAQRGLAKIFGNFGGVVPTRGELDILQKVFGQEFVTEIEAKMSLINKAKIAGGELANIPRSVMASLDLSAPFRQGLFLSARYPKQFFGAFKEMFKYAGSEKAYKALMDEIASRPNFELMHESKLALNALATQLSEREERFMSNWAEHIPVAGHLIRGSSRAYTGFLNKLRADVFDSLITKAERMGVDSSDPKMLADLGKFINAASGRGSLGALERAAVPLNATLFSPRLLASRLNLLNPMFYMKLDPFVRRQALESFFATTGAIATVLGLAKAGGASVNLDPRSADFAKIKIGNTRIDIAGGFQQYLRFSAQMLSGKIISTTTGKEFTLGEGYKPTTRMDIALRFIQSKENPIVSLVTDLLKGEDFSGQPVELKNELASRLVPMLLQDAHDLYQDQIDAGKTPDEGLKALALTPLAAFGFSLQTYGRTNPKQKDVLGENAPTKLALALQEVYTQTGHYPGAVSDTVYGKKLTKDEQTAYQKKTSSYFSTELARALDNTTFKNLSPEDKWKDISGMSDRAKTAAQKDLFGKAPKVKTTKARKY